MFSESIESTLNVATGPAHGPPLWLFHGLGRRWRDFAPLLPALTVAWHVRAVDHRGHGGSARAEHYLVPDYIADAGELVRQSNEPAVLVGHSLGGLTALGVAVLVPEAVRAVVLLDPPSAGYLARIDETLYATTWSAMRRLAGTDRPLGDVARELAELRLPGGVRFGDLRDAAALRFMAVCLRDLDPRTLDAPLAKQWLGGFDPLAAAARVRCPALVVAADPNRGGMLPQADAAALVKALADGALVNLPGVGHLVHWQDAGATLRMLLSFLASL